MSEMEDTYEAAGERLDRALQRLEASVRSLNGRVRAHARIEADTQKLIAERGKHAALLQERGLYASMWDRQREATEAEERLRIARETDELGVVVRRRTSEVS